MAIVEIAAKKKKIRNDVELSILGISTTKAPSITNFPKQFNPDAFQVWGDLLNSEWYAELKAEGGSATDLWYDVIREYMRDCADFGVFPFNHANQKSNNEVAMSFLNSSRLKVKRFLDDVEMFKQVKIARVERKYEFLPQSFTVTNIAYLKPITDPTFEKWLTRIPLPKFTPDGKGIYRKNLQANIDLTMEVRKGQTKLIYSIFCHTPVSIPDYSKMPTKSKLTQYAEKTLWLPIIRAHRFENIGGRLF